VRLAFSFCYEVDAIEYSFFAANIKNMLAQNSKYAAVTIVSMPYLALARVTGRSFREHNPDIDFFIFLADRPVAHVFEPADSEFRFLNVNDLELDHAESVFFRYKELELTYALTPCVIKHLLDIGYQGVMFLKQETLVLEALDTVTSHFSGSSVLLTPHLLAPIGRKGGEKWELNVLLSGVFNGGFIGFSNTTEARVFLDWWEQKTLEQCFLDTANGLHFEQRWLDFVPSFVQSYTIIRDPGMNVGHWNLLDRNIKSSDGKVTAMGMPCRIFRFSGYDAKAPGYLTRYNRDISMDRIGEAAAVLRKYQKMLNDARHEATSRLPYAFGYFDNGAAITNAMRKRYIDCGATVLRFGDPFETDHPGSFYAWLGSGSHQS